ncbi:MAG: hypothetical protein KIS86_06845 [Devosia sp.]|nr:hypothetical protein [Devosia sp.]
MSTRFPDYRPSTALRQAIEALRESKKRRAAAAHEAADTPGQGDKGGVPRPETAIRETKHRSWAPGREGTDIGATAGTSRRDIDVARIADIDALTSWRGKEE